MTRSWKLTGLEPVDLVGRGNSAYRSRSAETCPQDRVTSSAV
ncbi:hypothetical protein SLNHY_3875 [Streptomyces albus]|nr:hypothetical protein SLNHY_3875 [Streptomyces albus]